MEPEDFRKFKHELRTPVNHILGYSELLQETAEDAGDASTVTLARKIQSSGQTLARLMEKSLASNGSNGDQKLQIGALRTSVLPLAQEILTISASSEQSSYADDLNRVHSAAERLIALLTD
ncbi:MAG TPA: histidine kinase dimerization/phospho-acceptor domain-containing protein [Candidatus Angelobacter sp.]|nr:histidine kinase dimerization/phospho-acceptor domain-containing protein [Candidatus Angelobacter sp.]